MEAMRRESKVTAEITRTETVENLRYKSFINKELVYAYVCTRTNLGI